MAENDKDKIEEEIDKGFKRTYRRADMINDIKTIFSPTSSLTGETKGAVLSNFCWAFTERKEPVEKDGEEVPAPKAKIKGCEYWSKKAFEKAYLFDRGYVSKTDKNGKYLLCKTNANIEGDDKVFDEGTMVRHEHLIPKKVLISAFFDDTKYAVDNLETFLQYFNACVITADEDRDIDVKYKSAMPEEYGTFRKICEKNKHDCMWSRYQQSTDLMKEPMIVYKIQWGVKKGWVPIGITDVIAITADDIRTGVFERADLSLLEVWKK